MDYSPQIVDRWLREFELLQSLAETPSSSAHLLGSECRHSDKACSNGKPVGIKSTRHVGDPMRYCDLLADIRGAADLLPPYSLKSRVVAKRISTGAWLDRIAIELHTDQHKVRSAYRAACRMMAKNLGWEEDANTNVAAKAPGLS